MKGMVTAGRCFLIAVIAWASSLEAEEEQPVTSSIKEVTVYADRACVTRAAEITVGTGGQVYSLTGLPGWIDENSVRAALAPAPAGRVLDVQVERHYLAEASDKDVREAQLAVREIEDQLGVLKDEENVLDIQVQQIEGMRAFAKDKLPADSIARDVAIERYQQVVDFVGKNLRNIQEQRRALRLKRRELEPELSARQRKLNELNQLRSLEESTMRVTVAGDQDARAQLEVTYMLPGATWEAAHELRADGDPESGVTLVSYAVVTQTTGEEWNGAELRFSTQSPNEVIQIPEVTALLLGDTASVASVGRNDRQQSFQKAQQVFASQNTFWYNYKNPDEDLNDFRGNYVEQQEIQGRASLLFQQVRKRGTTAHYQAIGKPVVRSDGSSVRVPVATMSLNSEHKIVAAPQVSLNAVNTVSLRHQGEQPLLPGRTALYRDGAFLGTTDIPFVSPGESFAVMMGVADQLKLSRMLDPKESSLDRGKRNRMKVAFDLSVENLSEEPVELTLSDRIPVSENRDIEIYRVDIEPEVDPDKQGLLRWEVKLSARDKKAFRIEYTIEYPPEDVAEKARMFRVRAGATDNRDSSSWSISPGVDVDLNVMIEDLESNF